MATDDIQVGDDGRARLEKDMGLAIDPETGHAYESQGSFQNLGLNAAGVFYDGRAVPRAVRCSGCSAIVTERAWGQGFQGCGAFDFGPAGSYFLCPGCVERVFSAFPKIAGLVKAITGGDLKRHG